MADIEGLRVRGGWELAGDETIQFSPTDADAIRQVITGRLEELGVDLNFSGVVSKSYGPGMISQVNNEGTYARFIDYYEGLKAEYRKEPGGRFTHTIHGRTSVADSEVRASLVSENDGDKEVEYWLRGEKVTDTHRIGVVRSALGLGSS